MSDWGPETAIKVRDVGKVYRIYRQPLDRIKQAVFRSRQYFDEVPALRPTSFEIRRGETVGIVGRNGSGKSTLLQMIAGTLTPSSGSVEVRGRVAALLELGAGFNPEFTGRENIFLNSALLGLTREETQEKVPEILAFAEIGPFIDRPLRTYSSGMYVRLAFAVAISVDPDILIVDEALSVGDEAFQRKCFSRIEDLQHRGATILFVSHSAASVVQLCSRAILIDDGEKILDGRPKFVTAHYHRLLYAPPARRAALRAELMAMTSGRPAGSEQAGEVAAAAISRPPLPVSAPGEEEAVPAHYDPHLVSKSRIEYEPCGAVIEDPHLEDLQGERVNVVQRGESYDYVFRATFLDDAFSVRFGMYVKTVTGVELGGSSSAIKGELIDFVGAGATAVVRYRFACRLLTGTYFLNAGVSAMVEGERRFLHRIVDAVVFRVLPEPDLSAAGIVDFDIHPSVRINRPDEDGAATETFLSPSIDPGMAAR